MRLPASSSSTTPPRDFTKSLNDPNPRRRSWNDGSIRSIWFFDRTRGLPLLIVLRTKQLEGLQDEATGIPGARPRSGVRAVGELHGGRRRGRSAAGLCGAGRLGDGRLGAGRLGGGVGYRRRRSGIRRLRLARTASRPAGLRRLGSGCRRRFDGADLVVDRGIRREQRVVVGELVARRGERPARAAGDADAHDVASEALGLLRERDVVGVARDDDDVREILEAEHVFDGVDSEPDVGTVLRGREREQLHEVDCTVDELAAVARVHRGRPVGVGPSDGDGAERRGEIEHCVDVDRGRGELLPVSVLGVTVLREVSLR